MNIIVRLFFGAMAALFAYAAFLQLNDPDPLMWVSVYACGAVLAGLAAGNHPAPATFPGSLIALCLAWAFYLSGFVYTSGQTRPMYADQQLTGNVMLDTEEGREMGGLLVLAGGMSLLVVSQLYQRHRPVRGRSGRGRY